MTFQRDMRVCPGAEILKTLNPLEFHFRLSSNYILKVLLEPKALCCSQLCDAKSFIYILKKIITTLGTCNLWIDCNVSAVFNPN